MNKEKQEVCKIRMFNKLPCKNCKYYFDCFPSNQKRRTTKGRAKLITGKEETNERLF